MERKSKLRLIDESATCANIKRLMADRNLSPQEVKNELRLESVQAVYKWINTNNSSIPSTENLALLSQLFECTLEEIIVFKRD